MSLADIEARVRARHPRLFPSPKAPVAAPDRGALILGRNDKGTIVSLSERARLEHAHVLGTTGSGKSTFLFHCIVQDIRAGRGVCVVDPHGEHPDSLYRSILGWLERNGYTKPGASGRTIHLIDPNAGSHVTGFDPLALPEPGYEPSVMADAAVEALERVWGEEDINTKPTIQRVLTTVIAALCELGLTLAEARFLFDPADQFGIRSWAIQHLTDEDAIEELQWLHDIANGPRGGQEFRAEVTGPRNRLSKLIRHRLIRAMIGQQNRAIDLRAALDDGHIILVNLQGGARASDPACQLLGRLLTRFLFFHAQRRQRPERAFFFYLDECHLYLSGDIPRLLAEARKAGIGVVLSHQFLAQLEEAGRIVLPAVRSCTNIKVAFRLKDPVEAEEVARAVVPLDLELPVQALVKPTVIGHRRVSLASESTGEQASTTASRTDSRGASYAETDSHALSRATTSAEGRSSLKSQAASTALGTSQMSVTGSASGMTAGQMLTPELGLFEMPQVIGLSEAASSSLHIGQGTGSMSSRGQVSGSAAGRSSMRGEMAGEAWGQALSRGVSEAQSVGSAESRGTSHSRGTQDGFEPLYDLLPSAVHSKENVLHFAAETLRNLTTGRAFFNLVDAAGMRGGFLQVPPVQNHAPAPAAFETLREAILDRSSAALRVEDALRHVADRQRLLVEKAAPREPESATAYRTVKRRREEPKLPPEPATAAGYRTKRKRSEPVLP
jgi:type IV secretion system coupling TraD/TrwB family protein